MLQGALEFERNIYLRITYVTLTTGIFRILDFNLNPDYYEFRKDFVLIQILNNKQLYKKKQVSYPHETI